MTKPELRKKYKSLRAALSDDAVAVKSLALANQLLKQPLWEGLFYHVFLPIVAQKEVNTEYLLHILNGKDKNVVLSKSNFSEASLQHFLLTDATEIRINQWGIPEPLGGISIAPTQLDVVFVPLLSYDTHGHRVGYGKGFYDRFLQSCRPETLKIGLSFFPPEETPIPAQDTDIPLDYCATPERVYRFGK